MTDKQTFSNLAFINFIHNSVHVIVFVAAIFVVNIVIAISELGLGSLPNPASVIVYYDILFDVLRN
jgi:hypothetical protein